MQLNHPKLKAQESNLDTLQGVVKADSKQRFDLILEDAQGVKLASFGAPTVTATQVNAGTAVEASATSSQIRQDGIWWIKARQGHSIKVCSSAHYSVVCFLTRTVDGAIRAEAYKLCVGHSNRYRCSWNKQGGMGVDM